MQSSRRPIRQNSPLIAQIRATRLFGDSHGASGSSNQLGGLVAAGNPAQQPTPMASRRQDAWELQLKEKAFLVASIKPIVDDTITFKPTVPYALREVKRSMDKGVYFKDNTYGPAGLAGPAHATTMYEYGNWDQWAQTPAGNIAERNEARNREERNNRMLTKNSDCQTENCWGPPEVMV